MYNSKDYKFVINMVHANGNIQCDIICDSSSPKVVCNLDESNGTYATTPASNISWLCIVTT
jgi:hypothetical protein